MIIPTSHSTLFISFVYSDEIELSNCISGSIYSNPLLANFQMSVTSVFQGLKSKCVQNSSFVSTE